MKKMAFYLFLLWQTIGFSQSETVIKKLLAAQYPNTHKGGAWLYDKEDNALQPLNLPLITGRLKNTEWYKVTFSFIDDQHAFNSSCIILYHPTTKSLQMLAPIWFDGIKEGFYSNFIGLQLLNKNDIITFAEEFGTILLNDSNQHFKETVFEDNAITYKITLNSNDDDTVDNIIKVLFKNNRITEIQQICAKHLDVEKTIK